MSAMPAFIVRPFGSKEGTATGTHYCDVDLLASEADAATIASGMPRLP